MQKHLQKLLLIAALLCVPWVTQGQSLSDYTLSVDTTTFNSIVGTGTPLSFSTADDGYASTTLPFAFGFGENTFPSGSNIAFSANGFIRLNASSTSGTTASHTNASDYFITALLQQDAHIGRYSDAGAYYLYDATEGTFTIEYHLLGTYSEPYGAYSYQVVLHTNGDIEIIYDSVNLGGASSRTFATYLTDGPSNDRLYITGAWGSPVVSSTYSTRPYSTLPAHGLRYTLTRPNVSCPRPGAATVSNITPNSFDFAWVDNSTATSWRVQLLQENTIVSDNVVTVDSVSFTGLLSNTLYTARVAGICGPGDTSSFKPVQVRTECGFITTMPYENGFEDDPYYSSVTYADAFPYCWHRINDASGTYNYYPYITTTSNYVHNGTKGMYWYHSTTTTYADNEFAVLPGIDTSVIDISNLTLAFYAKTTSTSYHPQPIVGVMTDPNDATTFTPVHTFTATDITTAWQLFTVSFANYTGDGFYIAIKWPRPSSTCYLAIDDIFLTDDWCDAIPQNVTASSNINEVTVSWIGTAGHTYRVIFDGDTVSNITGNSYTFTGLTANTLYNYFVATECATSISIDVPGSIRTLCNYLDVMPYENGFEDDPYYSLVPYADAFPNCWIRINDATGSYNYYPYITNTTSYVHNGTKGMYWYHTTSTDYANNEFAVLPGIDTTVFSMSDLTLSFYAKTTSTSYHPQPIVGVMTDPNDASTFTPLYTFSSTEITTTWQLFAIPFANFTGYGNFIAIKWSRPSSSCYLAIDDIYLTNEWCNPPQNVTATSTLDEVTVSWSGSNDYSYSVILNNDTVTGITDHYYTFANLTPNTAYEYAVATECSSSTSMYMYGSIRTRCYLLDSLPYTMGFEASEGVSTGSTTSHTFVNCWYHLNNGTDYFGYPYVASSSSYNHTPGGSRGLYWYLTTTTGTYGDYEIVVLPGINTDLIPLNGLQLKFWARATSASYQPVFQVGVMTDPTDASTFQQVGVVEVSGTVYDEYVTSLGSYTGNGNYVAIRALRPTSSWYVSMDDITLEHLPSCPAIVNLTEEGTTPGGALITWGYMAGTDESPVGFQIMYDSVTGTAPTTVTTTEPYYAFSALAPGTTYTAYVRAHCGSESYGAWDSITFSTGVLGCGAVDPATGDTVYFSNSTTSQSGCLAYSSWGNTAYQAIWTAAELTAAGMTAGTIMGIDLGFSPASTYNKEFTIFMGSTSTTSISDATLENPNSHTQVYGPALHPLGTTGWQHYEFDVPFNWDGTSSIIITTFMNQPSGESHSSSTGLAGYYVSAANKARFRYKDSAPYTLSDYNSGSGGSTYSYRAAIHFYMGECIALATCADPVISVVATDTGSVELSWAPGYEETMWNLEYRDSRSSSWDTLELYLANNFYTVTDLTPGTVYDFRVSHYCDTNYFYSETTAHTECIADTVPFFVGFEASEGWTSGTTGTVPSPCWVKYTNYSTSYYPYVTNTTLAHSGSNVMYMYTYTYNSYEYFALPMLQTSLDSLMVSFWLYKSSSSYPDAKLQVGVMTDPEDFGTFTVLEEFVPSYGEGWVQHDVILSSYTGPAGHIAFANPVQGSTSYYPYMYIDDITVDYIPPCPHVRNVHTTMVTGDTIALAWTPNGEEEEWEVSYGDNSVVVNEPSALLTGMRFNSRYDFYIRSICSDDDTSTAASISVYSACGLFDTLPFFEDFEHARPGSSSSASFIPCWGHLNDGSYPGYPYISASTTYNHTPGGMKGIYWYYSNSTSYGNYQAIILPPVDTAVLPTNNLMLSFWAKPSSTSYEPVFYVGVMSDPNDIGTFYYYDTVYIDHLTTDWVKYTVRFDELPDTAYGSYVAIRANMPSNYWYAYVDDITLDVIPNCSPVEDLVVEAGPVSAILTWTPIGSSYNGATIEYKATSESSWNSTSVSGAGVNHAAITGLDPNTDYNLRVYAECDDGTSIAVQTTFSTRSYECQVYDSTNLINVTVGDPNGTTTSTYLPSYSYYNYGYTQQFFTAHEIGGTSTITKISVLPKVVAQQRTFEVYMGISADSSASGFITPLRLTCVYNGGYIPIVANRWLEFNLTTPFFYDADSGNLVVIFRDLTGSYVSGNAFLSAPAWAGAARYAYQDSGPYTPGSVSDGYDLSVRNVMKIFGGTCLVPSDCAAPPVVVTNVTSSTVDIAWANGNSDTAWNLYYRLADEDSYTLAAMGVTSTTYQFTGLQGGSNYEFMVVAVCSDSLSTTVNATTECSAISVLPYSENFNNWGSGTGRLPSCWLRTGTYSTYTYISTSYNRSGNTGGSIYMYSSSGSSVSYIVMPELDTNVYAANQTQLVFYAYQSSETYGIPAFEVGVMENMYDASTFVPVDTVYHSGNLRWEIFEVPLANYTGNGANVAVRTFYTNNYTYPYLDDFTLELIPTCIRPDSLSATNATLNSVDLFWNERGSATQWIVEYGPLGFQEGTGTTVVANSNPFTLTGLPSGFLGEYHVKPVCGAGDTGEYSRERFAFNTTQNPATIPYHYNFEDAAEWGNWLTSSNSTTDWYRGNAVADSGSYSLYISADSGATYKPYHSVSVVNAAAYRDIDFGTTDSSFTISFRARVGGTLSANYDGVMVFLVNPAIAPLPSNSNITSPWGNVNDLYRIATARRDTNWNTYTASFDTIHGIHRVAFFWFNQNTEASYPNLGEPVAVDNIHIDYSTCPRPVALSATPGTNTANLHWQGPSNANYEITYRPYPDGTTNTIVYSNTNHVHVSGLEHLTQYAFWVRRICGAGDTSLYSDGETFMTQICDNATTAVNYDASLPSSTSTYSPIGYGTYCYTYVQTIIDSAYLAGLNGDISAFSFTPTTMSSSDYYTNSTVYMANVPESDLSGGFILPDTNHVFVKVIDSADFSFTALEPQLHRFDTTFTWDGHSNVLFAVNREHGSWTTGSSFEAHTHSSTKMRYIYQDSGPYNIYTVSGGYTSSTVGDITLIACAGIACPDPVITSVTNDYQSATITWTGDGTDYEVNIKESSATDWPATDIAVSGNTYTFTGLNPTTYYTFRVRQNCSADSMGYSEWVENGFLTDSLPCFPPDSLHAIAVTNATATLDWNVNGNESAWDIHVWFAGFDSVYRVTARPATVGGFIAGVTYNASIRALCGANLLEGDWSDTVTFATAVCPNVTGLTAGNITANSITLNWTADPMAQSWVIEYGYYGFDQGTGTQVTTTTNSYVFNGLEDETDYDFYVKAVCGSEWLSENWANVNATTLSGGVTCDAPTNVSTTVADNSVTVNWTAGEGNNTFELEYGPHGFSHNAGTITNATTSPATISNLEYETQYDVYVRAICDQNTYSAWSIVATFTTGEQPSEDCDPVTSLNVTEISETTATVTWTPGATGDRWQVVVSDPNGSTVSDATVSEPRANLSGLTRGTNYTVSVRTDCGEGNYSAYVTANFRTQSEGIDDVTSATCTIYPNPTSSSTTISVSGVNGKVKIAVVDMNGRTVATETLECNSDCAKTMDVDNLAQGAYFVRITGDSVNMVKKLIVR